MKKVNMKKMILSILIGLSSFALFAVEYEQICKLPEGCRLDSYGNCPDCVLVPAEFVKPLPKDIYNGKVYLKPGKYEITKATNNEGFHSFWDKGVYLDIYTIGEEIYLVNINGIGKINGKKVDCSDPVIFSMELDSNGKMLSRKDISKGSCHLSEFVPDTHWSLTSEGVKKVKKWSVGPNGGQWECVVGPCDFIKEITHTFYYKRVING